MYADSLLSSGSCINKIIDADHPSHNGGNLSYLKEEEEYVQLAELPSYDEYPNQAELLDTWKAFMDFRDNVLKALEEARNEKNYR